MKARVLVVDDEPSLLRLTEYSLRAEGYTVTTAETAAEGLRKVHTERPDLLVLDVMLPDMSGVEVCQQIRGNPETADLPIIMLSARALTTDKVKGLRSGADEYVTKPVDSARRPPPPGSGRGAARPCRRPPAAGFDRRSRQRSARRRRVRGRGASPA
ncbi:MAG TPA: response regulator [Thermoanaerobaculia bacterium]|nr:response regulator [Thermoanaerobaculia bacterium]